MGMGRIPILVILLFYGMIIIKSQEIEPIDNPSKGANEKYIDFGESIYDSFFKTLNDNSKKVVWSISDTMQMREACQLFGSIECL